MKSIKFPKMFGNASTKVWKSTEFLEATKQNTMLTLLSERGELIGDPYFGLLLRHYLFEQNNYVLKDKIIDMIYTQLVTFIPQIYVERKDIEISQPRGTARLICKFKGINQIDYTTNMYSLVLFDQQESNR